MREVKALLVLFLMIVLLSSTVNALGLAYEYMENKTLKLGPGENYYFKLTIQNEQDEYSVVNVTLDSDIANLVGGGVVAIPPKTYDRFVYFNITVPPNATDRQEYWVRYNVNPAGGRGSGQVPFSVRYYRKIRVEVVGGWPEAKPTTEAPKDIGYVIKEPEPEPAGYGWLITIALVMVISLLLLLIWRRSSMVSDKIKPEKAPKTPLILDKPEEKSKPSSFYTSNGLVLKSIWDFYDALKLMDEATFTSHVTPHKNDFSQWLDASLGKKGLAARIAPLRSKDAMIKVLEDEFRSKR
ncbi:hypothetical protein ACFL1B_00235 [Nanoarchaeota archaeon]